MGGSSSWIAPVVAVIATVAAAVATDGFSLGAEAAAGGAAEGGAALGTAAAGDAAAGTVATYDAGLASTGATLAGGGSAAAGSAAIGTAAAADTATTLGSAAFGTGGAAVESTTLGSAATLGDVAGAAAGVGGSSTANMLGYGALGLMAANALTAPKMPDLGSVSTTGTPTSPTLLDSNSQAAMDQANQNIQARLARGRSSTLLTGGQGSGVGQTTSHLLLGS